MTDFLTTESERRTHVRIALAENRIEGIPPSPAALELCAAYIRGEIEVCDLMEVYKRMVSENSCSTGAA